MNFERRKTSQKRHLEFFLQKSDAVIHRGIDDTVAVDPNGCRKMLQSNGTDLGITMRSLREELLVKAVAVPGAAPHKGSAEKRSEMK